MPRQSRRATSGWSQCLSGLFSASRCIIPAHWWITLGEQTRVISRECRSAHRRGPLFANGGSHDPGNWSSLPIRGRCGSSLAYNSAPAVGGGYRGAVLCAPAISPLGQFIAIRRRPMIGATLCNTKVARHRVEELPARQQVRVLNEGCPQATDLKRGFQLAPHRGRVSNFGGLAASDDCIPFPTNSNTYGKLASSSRFVLS